MTYQEVVHTIENKRRFGNLAGVEITAQMLAQVGNPQTGMKWIHIAGTNGKGSVSAFLCHILQAAGYRTGMFTSPHLVDFRERIRVNGEMISQEDTARLGERLLQEQFGVHPTMFDYCLVMALQYFKEQKCDVVILETGLGGRLDSTNAVGVPEVSVITKIGYDHMTILGDTLEQIAAEKAGIIKKGTRLVVESQKESVAQVFQKAAEEAGAADIVQIRQEELKEQYFDGTHQHFSFRQYKGLEMQMLGVHQYENAAAAILAAEYFSEAVHKMLTEGAVREGIRNTNWKGRMQIISQEPYFMVDGAHNSNGVAALRDSLAALFPDEKFHFIMGVMADKDYEEMVGLLTDIALDFVTVTVESQRALQADELADCIRANGIPASCKSLKECLASIDKTTGAKTIAFGSLYFVGEIFTNFLQN
jgi:dihydrofolate synthase/folylpolyglutamate synthase